MQKAVKETIKGTDRTAAKLNGVFVVPCTSESEKEILTVGWCRKDVF